MLCVFDVNETLLDLAALDDFFADLTGDPAARRDWFSRIRVTISQATARVPVCFCSGGPGW